MVGSHSIRIPVHGFVEFNDWERDIINHPVFQRLRRIRQLALCDHLYPGATHTRFEHSLGVMHVATRFYDALVRHHHRLLLEGAETAKARALVRLAALLHDVGHAPFSHTGEEVMPLVAGRRLAHEDYSAALIRHEMVEVIDDHEFNRERFGLAATEVADFIAGRGARLGRLLFWRDLVSGQLDADRADYLLRDAHHCGVAYGRFDLDRIVDTITLVENRDRELPTDLRIAIAEGGRHAAEGLMIARYFMFQQVYFHKVRKAYDYHAGQCLKETLRLRFQGESLPDPCDEAGRQAYIDLDDWTVLEVIKRQPGNRHCRAIRQHLHDRCVWSVSQGVDLEANLEWRTENRQKLANEDIEVWEADSSKDWYKRTGELLIAPECDSPDTIPVGDPLSSFEDSVAASLDRTNELLLFVPHDQTERAREILSSRGS